MLWHLISEISYVFYFSSLSYTFQSYLYYIKISHNLLKEHSFVIVPWSTCLWIYRVCGLYILLRLLCHWPETDEAMNLIVTLVSLMSIFVRWQSHDTQASCEPQWNFWLKLVPHLGNKRTWGCRWKCWQGGWQPPCPASSPTPWRWSRTGKYALNMMNDVKVLKLLSLIWWLCE